MQPTSKHHSKHGKRTQPSRLHHHTGRSVLDDNDRVTGLLQHGLELRDGESSANLQVCETPIKFAQDGRVAAGNVEHLEPLQIPVVVKDQDETSLGRSASNDLGRRVISYGATMLAF